MQNCIRCTKKMWSNMGEFEDGRRKMRCRNCGQYQLEVPSQGLYLPAKILYFDIETSLMTFEAFHRRVRGEWMRTEQILESWYIITWAAVWLGQSHIYSARVTEREAKRRTDKNILRPLWDMMNIADYIVGHNSDAFDIKKSHTRFIANGMGLPYKSKQRDTFKLVKKYFADDSNALDYWMEKFGQHKREMSYADWSRINRNPQQNDIDKMHRYCRQDVRGGAVVMQELRELIEVQRGDVLFK